MGKLLDFLSGPVSSVLGSVRDIINDLHTSDEEKLKAQQKLVEIENDFRKALLEADARFAEAQERVLRQELASQSWLARNWRPLLMLVFTYIIAHNFVIAPIFSVSVLEIPTDMWELLKIGMGGYIIGRSAEKITPEVAKALASRATRGD